MSLAVQTTAENHSTTTYAPTISSYEEGAALVQQLRKLLDEAELRVQRLQGDLEEGANFREDVEPYTETAAADDAG